MAFINEGCWYDRRHLLHIHIVIICVLNLVHLTSDFSNKEEEKNYGVQDKEEIRRTQNDGTKIEVNI